MTFRDDHDCPERYGIGFTDIETFEPIHSRRKSEEEVKETQKKDKHRDAEAARRKEFQEGAQHLREKLLRFRPQWVCFVGYGVFQAFTEKPQRKVTAGWVQDEWLDGRGGGTSNENNISFHFELSVIFF